MVVGPGVDVARGDARLVETVLRVGLPRAGRTGEEVAVGGEALPRSHSHSLPSHVRRTGLKT